MRGNSGAALGDLVASGIDWPHVAAPGRRWSLDLDRSCRSAPTPPGPCRGSPGSTEMATIRSASRASPITRSTSGPGSAFHGSFCLEVRVGGADEAPGGLERPARLDLVPARSGVCSNAVAAAGASGLSGSGAVPTPPHFLATTVATRAARLPRLLARSELYRPTRPSYVKSPSLPYGGVGEDVVAEAVESDVVDQVEGVYHVA